jgi:hypothetical protein
MWPYGTAYNDGEAENHYAGLLKLHSINNML